MIPEGLQYQSIESIVSTIKSMGMNVIRLTYAIEMIDDILDNGGDVSIQTSFQRALGTTNGSNVFTEVVKNNPSFSSNTTSLQVFDAIAAEYFKQHIYVHLDNHVSKATWCCSETDGNAWFDNIYFDVTKWQRGLQYMARYGASWGNVMSMSLLNELRSPNDNPGLASSTYGWTDWYPNIASAAKAINSANNHVLIFLSSLNYDTTLSPIPTAIDLGNGEYFRKSKFAFSNKLVLELHNYATDATNCSDLESSLYGAGFDALDAANKSIVNVMPVVMMEWGHLQDSPTYQSVYVQCLHGYLPRQKADWMVWVVAGSYYIWSGTQDLDETWGEFGLLGYQRGFCDWNGLADSCSVILGLLNHDWSAFRDPADVDQYLKHMVAATLHG